MIEKTIERVNDLIEAVSAAESDGGHQVWARGHRDSGWKLLPSAHRKAGILESQIAQLFRLRAPSRYAACPPHDDLSAWLALMRHYGLSTRLLDWSESPLVAAFFAVADTSPERDAAIWLLDPGALAEVSSNGLIPLLSSSEVSDLVRGAFKFSSGDRTVAVQAPQADLRMALQMSHYTIHGNGDPLEELYPDARFLTKLTIPHESVSKFCRELCILGIRRSLLFPDLSGLAQELEEIVEISDETLLWE